MRSVHSWTGSWPSAPSAPGSVMSCSMASPECPMPPLQAVPLWPPHTKQRRAEAGPGTNSSTATTQHTTMPDTLQWQELKLQREGYIVIIKLHKKFSQKTKRDIHIIQILKCDLGSTLGSIRVDSESKYTVKNENNKCSILLSKLKVCFLSSLTLWGFLLDFNDIKWWIILLILLRCTALPQTADNVLIYSCNVSPNRRVVTLCMDNTSILSIFTRPHPLFRQKVRLQGSKCPLPTARVKRASISEF